MSIWTCLWTMCFVLEHVMDEQGYEIISKGTYGEQLELSDMCHIFLGETGRDLVSLYVSYWDIEIQLTLVLVSNPIAITLSTHSQCQYLSLISVYIYGSLACYCSVFAHSMSSHFTVYVDETSNYEFFLAIFFVAVVTGRRLHRIHHRCVHIWFHLTPFQVPISCMELTEQVELQVALSICRVLLVICMLGSIMVSLHSSAEGADRSDGFQFFEFTDFPDAPYGAPLWNWDGAMILLPLATFANLFQHSLPSLSQPVEVSLWP